MRARPVFTVKVGSVVPAVLPAAAPLIGNSVDIVSSKSDVCVCLSSGRGWWYFVDSPAYNFELWSGIVWVI